MTGAAKWINYPVMSTKIKASETVMALDCVGTAAGKPESQRTAYYQDGSKDLNARGNKASFVDPPRLTARSERTASMLFQGSRAQLVLSELRSSTQAVV